MQRNIYNVVLVISTYWILSLSTVFINHYLVGRREGINLAVFVGWTQCWTTVLLVLFIKQWRSLDTGRCISPATLSATCKTEVVFMSLTFVGMISCNNLCLKLVGLVFFQLARSTTLIFTVFFAAILLRKITSLKVFLCCLVVSSGFMLGIDQEQLSGSFSLQGVAFGVATSVFISLHGILTKKALDVVGKDPVFLTLLVNLNAIVIYIPVLITSGQWTGFYDLWSKGDWTYCLCLALSGVLACSMSWISALQIKVTSPLTHHISANSKSILQTVIAVVYYQDSKSLLWWTSVVLAVGGSFAYAAVRIQETEAEEELPSEPSLRHDLKRE